MDVASTTRQPGVFVVSRSQASDWSECADWNSQEAKALVHSLVQLGKNLNLDIVAEGIEHTDQLEQLQAEDCNHGQGYLLARPLKTQAATRFLAARDGAIVGLGPRATATTLG